MNVSYNINHAAVKSFTDCCRETRKLCDALVNKEEGLLIANILAANTTEKELQLSLLKIRDLGGLAKEERDSLNEELKSARKSVKSGSKSKSSLDVSSIGLSKGSEKRKQSPSSQKRGNGDKEKMIRSSSNHKRPSLQQKF